MSNDLMGSHDIMLQKQATNFTNYQKKDDASSINKSKFNQVKPIGSSKILPYDLNSFDANTAHKLMRIKHGANTILNKDEVPIDRSVLNSRFLISDFLQKHQKVYLIKDKIEFQRAQDDIFEKRHAQNKQKQREEARRKAISYQNNWNIKPYQRKLVVTPRIFKADEEQLEYLQHLGLEPSELVVLIQKEYDEPYISNLLVTGTLSLALHDKKSLNIVHKTRKIQNVTLQNFTQGDEVFTESLNQSMNQGSMSYMQNNQSVGTISNSSPLKRAKTGFVRSGRTMMKAMNAKEQLNHDVKTSIFVKATKSNAISKSKKTQRSSGQSGVLNVKKRIGMTTSTTVRDQAARRQAILMRQAAKDPALQKKLILSAINKDAQQSNLFKALLIKRKNRISDEEIAYRPSIKGMLDIHEDDLDKEEEEESDSDEEDIDSDFGDDIQDDFIDWPIDCRVEVMKAKKQALSQKKNIVQWSGQDVLQDYDPHFANKAISKISSTRIWPKRVYGYWKRCRVPIKNFVKGAFFDNFLTIAVFINTVALALDRYGISAEEASNLSTMNTIFTWIFIVEAVLKIIGLGIVKYLKDKMNYLDCAVVMLSIVEMSFLSGSGTNLSAFRAIRIFRIFRVLRVARLLKGMKSMQIIIGVLMRSMDQFIYVLLLLLLFIFIYALLGMQIFGDNLYFDENYDGPAGVPIANYNTFNAAFLTTFQIMTMEAWNYLFYDALRSGVAQPITVLYYISWVFLGNFMLLNLFLAILLEGFSTEDSHKAKKVEDPKAIRRKLIAALQRKEGQTLIEYYQEENDATEANKGGAAGGLNKKKKKKKKTKADEHILDESFDYDKDVADMKKTSVKKKKKDYEGCECEYSFYVFHKNTKFRKYLYKMVSHFGFEGVILVLIILSSIKLVVDTYMFDLKEDDPIVKVSQQIDYFFTIVFALESLLKSIAYGFVQDNGSYLRETWSQLDFFIVVTSIIDASFENINLPIIKILRLLRTLRPLRFISHNSGMKTIVMALLGSVGGIFNVLIVVVVVWMIFAILAVNFYGGKMQYCTVDEFKMQTREECLYNRGQWKTKPFNFDSVPSAMFTLFAVASIENWQAVMFDTINSGELERGPIFLNNILNGYFFVVYLLIGSFLFLNLFFGVIFKEFEDAIEEEKAATMLKENQIAWVDMMRMIVNAAPDLETTNKPKTKWRAAVHTFITGENFKVNWFDIFIMTCIVLNMLQMAINYESSSLEYNQALENINYFFTAVFVLECVLKFIAFGLTYFKNSWNVFDFCVVCASMIDIVMAQLNQTSLRFLRVGPQLARVMRVMRVSRLLRLVNKYRGLQALIQTIQFSLPALMNVFSLLMLVYFIFAVLATFLFREVKRGNSINDYANFTNFSYSMMMIIRMSTGEDWNGVMIDCMQTEADGCIPGETCGFGYAPIFFIPYIMLSSQIMLNLFIMVIIQQFEKYYLSDDNVMERFKANLELFKTTWTKFTRDQNCLKLKDTKLVSFFKAMDKPLGMKGMADKDVIKQIVLMGVVTDEEGFVYFNELLFKAMRIVYGETHVKNRILVDQEIKAREKIESIKLKLKQKSWKEQRTQAAQVNPFMLQMMMNISFKAWLKQYRLNLEKREAAQQLEQEGVSPDNAESLISEDPDPADNQSPNLEDEYEYATHDDMTASEDESPHDGGGSYEQDDSNDDINNQDSSRMLRQRSSQSPKTILVEKVRSQDQMRKSGRTSNIEGGLTEERLEKLLMKERSSDRHESDKSSGRMGTNQSASKFSPASQKYPILEEPVQPNKRLSNRINLQVEIPRKRVSNSQQPVARNIPDEFHDKQKKD